MSCESIDHKNYNNFIIHFKIEHTQCVMMSNKIAGQIEFMRNVTIQFIGTIFYESTNKYYDHPSTSSIEHCAKT